MQRSVLAIPALLTAAALSSACNDLGTCDDPARGRKTVSSAGQLMFAGQAILNKSCATGCHNSSAKGAGRYGAPAGLDFDLLPVTDGTVTATGITLTPAALNGLRSRQRDVYNRRELIWEQVEKGLMPPTNAYEVLSSIVSTMFGSDGKCTAGGQAYTTLSAHKEEFRQWLACDTPIVEATSDMLAHKPLAAGASPADMAAGAAYYSIPNVSVGYQYPSCGGGASGGSVSFSEVYTTVFMAACALCHLPGGLNSTVDFSTEDAAWTSLMGAAGTGRPQTCMSNPSPYVTPNDPAKSYLINKMDPMLPSGQRCDDVMPLGSGSTAPHIALVKAWIMAGATRMPIAGGAADAGVDGGS
jgi:hypothetical protein